MELAEWEPLWCGHGGDLRALLRSAGGDPSDPNAYFHADGCAAALTDLAWVMELSDFGDAAGDPDAQLVPRLVAAVAVPRVVQRLRSHYDPLSGAQTRLLVQCVGELLEFEPDAKVLRELLGAPLAALRAAVAGLCVPLLALGAPPVAAAFAVRQCSAACKLLRQCGAWAALVEPAALAAVALGDLLGGRLAPALLQLARLGHADEALQLTVCAARALPPDLRAVGWRPALERLKLAPLLAALAAALPDAPVAALAERLVAS